MKEIKQIGNVLPTKNRDNPNQGRVYDSEGLSPCIDTMQGGNLQPCVVGGLNDKKWGSQYHQQDRVYSSKGIAMCCPANIPGGSYKYMIQEKKYRIRKLTPKECWRLMGFTDEEFEKAAAVNSNTQLYKQAGNSIVVDVLVAIFSEMINSLEDKTPKYQYLEQMSLFDYE